MNSIGRMSHPAAIILVVGFMILCQSIVAFIPSKPSLLLAHSRGQSFSTSTTISLSSASSHEVTGRKEPSNADENEKGEEKVGEKVDDETSKKKGPHSLYLHHTAIKTRDIENAIKFYSLLGYEVEHKFRSGPARAAWLTNSVFKASREKSSSTQSSPSSSTSSPPPSMSTSTSSSSTTLHTVVGYGSIQSLQQGIMNVSNEKTATSFYNSSRLSSQRFASSISKANDTNDQNASSNSSSTITTTIKGQNDVASRIELIEVPPYMLDEKPNTVKKAIDLVKNESLLGLNHYALDVTSYIQFLREHDLLGGSGSNDDNDDSVDSVDSSYYGLDQFLEYVEQRSLDKFNKTLRIAVKPRQQVIGNQVYELAFMYDADGTVVELVRYIKEVELKDGQEMDSGWEPWDGRGFVGQD